MNHDPVTLTARLLADGYCIVPGLLGADTITALDRDLDARFIDTPYCQGGFYGERTKRFGALLRRSRYAEDLVRHALILQIVDAVLGQWCDRFVLNLTQAVEIHGGALAQIPHRDQDIWGGSKGEIEYQINVVWPLSEFTSENGATRIWPGSHRVGASSLPVGEGSAVEMQPGSALLFLGSTLHGGGANVTQMPRRAVIVGYCLGWLRTFENQYLAYPPEIARHFDPDLAALIGYAQHRPNLGNVEGQCPSVLLQDGNHETLAAIDAMRPDQAEAIARHAAEQAAARAGLMGG